jgi:hypothetical protein
MAGARAPGPRDLPVSQQAGEAPGEAPALLSHIDRREFIKSITVCGATAALGGFALGSHAAQKEQHPAWIERATRWAQLTLVEDDPGRFNLAFWLGYFQRTRSNAACLSAGGCVAYYPTTVPFHHRSAWLADRDPFGDLVAGCRTLGMVVIARTDPHATYDDVRQAHPEWIAVDAEDKPRRHWASPEMWVTCALGSYNFEFMTAVHREIMSRYKVDGIFINRWDGSGTCYCGQCRAAFKSASGLDLPRTNNPRDNVRRTYVLWRQQTLFELWQLWDKEIRKINPEARVIPNTGGGATSSLDMKKIGTVADTLFADRQARRGLSVPWSNGKNGKEFRATMGSKPIVGIFSVGLEEPYRWKDSVQSEAEIRIWVADGIANGLRPWFTKFSGTLRDERWLKVVADVYSQHARWEKYLINQVPLARVGLVYSQQTAWFYGDDRFRDKVEDPTLGWYHALVEARIPFEMVHDRLLEPGRISQLKTLILPNTAALSDEQCSQLRQFVNRGGGLVATYETSLCDEWGDPRRDFGVADLFGVSFKGRGEGPMHNSYLQLQHDAPTAHALLSGLEDAPRIVNGVWRLEVEPHQSSPSLSALTLIPSYPDLPMEKVYPRTSSIGPAQVFMQECGAGRVVYFPWDIDRTFWEILSPDHGRILANAVHWATNEPALVRVSGPGILDITAWRQPQSITVHLVNLTNPMMMKGPFRELIPVGEQKIELRLPDGLQARRAKLLAANKTVRVVRSGPILRITVPSVLDHEIVAIDLVSG